MVLRLASFVADNVIKYLECKAYKVLCWDPEVGEPAAYRSSFELIISSMFYSGRGNSERCIIEVWRMQCFTKHESGRNIKV